MARTGLLMVHLHDAIEPKWQQVVILLVTVYCLLGEMLLGNFVLSSVHVLLILCAPTCQSRTQRDIIEPRAEARCTTVESGWNVFRNRCHGLSNCNQQIKVS